jgi:hypothetical protein
MLLGVGQLFHRDEFHVLLCTQVFAPDQVALVSNSHPSAVFAGEEINLENTRMKARDLRQIHAEFPNYFQGSLDLHGLF